ncbi:MAG: hypothetical protein AB7O24_09015 [Kofleriaceae bacterium]
MTTRFGWATFVVVLATPWLALAIDPSNVLGEALAAIVVSLGALSGLGAAVAIVLRDRDAELVDRWGLGLAAYLVLGGMLAAIHTFTQVTQLALMISGLALQSIVMVTRRERVVAAMSEWVRSTRISWLVVTTVVGGIVLIHIIGQVSLMYRPSFDDDGNWLVAVARMRDAGGFGDFIGYPRANQLGGSVIATGLIATADELRLARVPEALGFLLVISALARVSLPRRDRAIVTTKHAQAAMVFLLLVLGISAKAQAETELWAFWIPVFLVIASYRVLAAPDPWTARRSVHLGLVVGALASFRHEYIPLALALIAVSTHSPDRRADWRSLLTSTAAAVVAVGPLFVDRYIDRSHITISGVSAVKLVVTSVVSVGLLALAVWGAGLGARRALPRFTLALAVGSALIYLAPTRSGAYSNKFVWTSLYPIAFVLVAELARAQWQSGRDGVRYRFRHYVIPVVLLLPLLSVMRAEDSTVPANWRSRFRPWFANARISTVLSGVPGFEPYREVLSSIPPGAPVLAWVLRPERLDFRSREIFDLRVPNLKDLRKQRWGPSGPLFERIREETGARYLLIQLDRRRERRDNESVLYEVWCSPERPDSANSPYFGRPPECADDLERLWLRYHTIASRDNVYLIDLDQPLTAVNQVR